MTISQKKDFIINIIYITLIAAIVYLFLKYVLILVMPFIIGYLIAILIMPAIKIVSSKFHIPQKITAVFLVLLSYVGIGLFVSLVGARFFVLIKSIIARLPEIYTVQIEPSINNIFDSVEKASSSLDPMMVQVIQDMAVSISQSSGLVLSKISSTVIEFVSSSVSFLPGLFLGIIFSVISSLFFAIDYNKIFIYISNKLLPKNSSFLADLKVLVTTIGYKYLKAYAILMAVTFVELSLGLLLLRVEGAIMISALIAIIDFFPVLGTGGVVIPWIIIELIQGNFPFALGLITVYITITIVRNILEPKLIGAQIGLHPLVMLISMYIGVNIFGFVGLVALPFTIVIIKYLYDNNKIQLF